MACSPDVDSVGVAAEPTATAVDAETWSAYLEAAAEADRIEDAVDRCRAYPDLPGNDWVDGAAQARCPLLASASPSIAQIEATLLSEGGAERLEREYDALLDAHYADPARRESIFRGFYDFSSSDDSRRVARLWLAQSPDSPYARMAMGRYSISAAAAARGNAAARNTAETDLQAMQRLMVSAVRMLQSALEAEPRLSPACTDLMYAARLLGDRALRDTATSHCLAVDPLSWRVRFQQQMQLDPRWGGSFAELDASVETLRPLTARNPALGGMLARGRGLRAYLAYLGKRAPLRELAGEFEAASRIAPDPLFIGEAGIAAKERGDFSQALGYLSQAVRLAPENTRFLRVRADVRRKLNDYEGSVLDAQRAIAIDPGSGRNYAVLGQSLAMLGRTGEARQAFHDAMQFPQQRQWAFMRWCETYILGALERDEALACTQGLLNEYPDEAEALFMRSVVLYKLGAEAEAATVAARFQAVVDRGELRQRQMISELARIARGE